MQDSVLPQGCGGMQPPHFTPCHLITRHPGLTTAAVGRGHDKSRLLISRYPVRYQTTGTLRSPLPSPKAWRLTSALCDS